MRLPMHACVLAVYLYSRSYYICTPLIPSLTVRLLPPFTATPLAMIQSMKKGEPDYAQWEQWGYDILTTGIFTIIICATLGLLLIHFTSTRFLELVRKLLVFVGRCGVGSP